MKLSVVIPAYNEELFLPFTLASLQKQTFPHPFEIIVVDNNSKDKTAAIAKKYDARLVYEPKQGYATALNAGFRAARGDIIVRADADYIVPSSWLQAIWDEFEKDSGCVALGGPTFPIEGSSLEKFFYCPGNLAYMYFLKLLRRGFLFGNMSVRRHSFFEVGGFNEKLEFGEDIELCRRLEKKGVVKITPHTFVYASARRLHDLGLFNFIVRYSIENWVRLLLKRKIKIGTNPVRIAPKLKFHPYNPWIYFQAWGVIGGVLVFLVAVGISVGYPW